MFQLEEVDAGEEEGVAEAVRFAVRHDLWLSEQVVAVIADAAEGGVALLVVVAAALKELELAQGIWAELDEAGRGFLAQQKSHQQQHSTASTHAVQRAVLLHPEHLSRRRRIRFSDIPKNSPFLSLFPSLSFNSSPSLNLYFSRSFLYRVSAVSPLSCDEDL